MMHVLLFVPSGQMLKQNSIPQYMHTFNLDIYECNQCFVNKKAETQCTSLFYSHAKAIYATFLY